MRYATRNAGPGAGMYEHMIARANQSNSRLRRLILVSQGRRLRDLSLASSMNRSFFNDGDLPAADALNAIQSVMQENVPGYKPFVPACRYIE